MLIGLLHSVVPHQHHAIEENSNHCALSAAETHQEHGFLDWLGDFFHLSQGNDHLENLRKSETSANQLGLGLTALNTQTFQLLIFSAPSPVLFKTDSSPLIKTFRIVVRPLRGPPALV
jgi:hypothetical protein